MGMDRVLRSLLIAAACFAVLLGLWSVAKPSGPEPGQRAPQVQSPTESLSTARDAAGVSAAANAALEKASAAASGDVTAP